MRQARRSGGCTSAHIAADVDEANAFWYVEDWQDAAALEGDLKTDRFSQLLALMETSEQPPALEFRMVGETRGLDYVAAARARQGYVRSVTTCILEDVICETSTWQCWS